MSRSSLQRAERAPSTQKALNAQNNSESPQYYVRALRKPRLLSSKTGLEE